MAGKRIKDLTTASGITYNDYLPIDNSNNSAATKTSAMPLKNVDAIAAIQNNLVAIRRYDVGDQFVYQGNVYRATATITSGGTITINGNCALANDILDQVTAFNNALTWKLLGSITSGNTMSLPSNYNELLIIIQPYYSASNKINYTFYMPKDRIALGESLTFRAAIDNSNYTQVALNNSTLSLTNAGSAMGAGIFYYR